MPEQQYSIGQLAKAAAVPTSTLRYYERAKLITPDFRTGGNYRGYGARALERLKFIRAAQGAGLSLTDIGELLAMADGESPACDDVMGLMRRRLAEIRARIEELKQVERVLSGTLDKCCKGADPDICAEIHRLSGVTLKTPAANKSSAKA
ncbi:MAG TPA: MerR family DNA-binding protein [Tepidisphaeraceae bacterium]|nr:MerR family DNA-binding protein [Tepidisphaeraceae bacterium]